MIMKDHLVHIQKLYTISVETESEANTAYSDGILLKRVFTNEYCFVKQSSDVLISFFLVPIKARVGLSIRMKCRFIAKNLEDKI